ncbi:hypothetical protein L1987_85383 [Smallanthus sonchifolius]|uniref:Uncharacterized protein n=1 Tax=Smallanthus sonchifolius TaxID=185202 RepID=A0ACB8XVQ8_9ASTR|nr:hypothetical protein L1987_85383 [Smallanthus sonchifolius]
MYFVNFCLNLKCQVLNQSSACLATCKNSACWLISYMGSHRYALRLLQLLARAVPTSAASPGSSKVAFIEK